MFCKRPATYENAVLLTQEEGKKEEKIKTKKKRKIEKNLVNNIMFQTVLTKCFTNKERSFTK